MTQTDKSHLICLVHTGLCSATDCTGAFLIDRSPEYFEPLLNFLRHNKLILNEGINPQGWAFQSSLMVAILLNSIHPPPPSLSSPSLFLAGVLEEAKFFGISKAIEPLESLIETEELAVHGQFTRKEFLRMLSITSSSSTLRCQVGKHPSVQQKL